MVSKPSCLRGQTEPSHHQPNPSNVAQVQLSCTIFFFAPIECLKIRPRFPHSGAVFLGADINLPVDACLLSPIISLGVACFVFQDQCVGFTVAFSEVDLKPIVVAKVPRLCLTRRTLLGRNNACTFAILITNRTKLRCEARAPQCLYV